MQTDTLLSLVAEGSVSCELSVIEKIVPQCWLKSQDMCHSSSPVCCVPWVLWGEKFGRESCWLYTPTSSASERNASTPLYWRVKTCASIAGAVQFDFILAQKLPLKLEQINGERSHSLDPKSLVPIRLDQSIEKRQSEWESNARGKPSRILNIYLMVKGLEAGMSKATVQKVPCCYRKQIVLTNHFGIMFNDFPLSESF